MVEGSLALDQLPPRCQETFQSTSWKCGNTGITKALDYNNRFKMLYRVVNLNARILDLNNILVKKCPETPDITRGQDNHMVPPYSVDDPDPAAGADISQDSKIIVFPNLPSVQAARKDKNSLNIAYDCEYQSVDKDGKPNNDGKYRIILSYQFALYLNDSEILEVVFLTCDPSINNRLGYRTCLGAILDLLKNEFQYCYLSYKYSDTRKQKATIRRLYFKGSDDSYKQSVVFDTVEEAKEYLDSQNPLVVIDKSNQKVNDFKEVRKDAFSITLVCHTAVADITAFADDKYGIGRNGSILPVFKPIQGGLVTMDKIFTHVPTALEYWKYYPVKIEFRDTMCYAPAGSKSLDALGKSIQVRKIRLSYDESKEAEIKSHMLSYFHTNPQDFIVYAAQDALVTIMYGSRLWGINKEWCLTSTSGSAFAMKQSIMSYFGIANNEKNTVFERSYRGMKTVSKGLVSTPSGLRPVTEHVAINPDAELLHNFAANSYCGGYNTCISSGVYRNSYFLDHDLKGAYPVAMCLVMDIDFDSERPIEREFKDEELTLQAFHTPVDPMFCYVDFEFPISVKFPCIAIHDEGSIIFPRKGTGVFVSGPSLYLALQLGARVYVRRGYVGRIRLTKTLQPSMSLRSACKQMVQDRNIAKEVYGNMSIEEQLIKLFVNGGYGKISQNVIEKHTWDGWNKYMTDIGASSITSPERAALITDIVRCMLIGTLNQLHNKKIRSYSVTTDGFITEATIDDLNSCDAYGFKPLFEDARRFLTDGDPSIWEVKHEQTDLVNPTTRCNVGYGIDMTKDDGTIIKDGKGVLAHGGYVSPNCTKDSREDRYQTTKVILNRTGRIECTVKEFKNIKELSLKNMDFHTEYVTRRIRLDFDMKRKPVRSSFETVNGVLEDIKYEYCNFDTEPFENLTEYHRYRDVNKSFNCIRTKTDWDRFYLKLQDRADGYKRVTKDMEWCKLCSVIQGYHSKLWDLPEVTDAETVADKIAVINRHNHSKQIFKTDTWKNCRKPERASKMLPEEFIKDLLEEFNYIPTEMAHKDNTI